MSRIRIRDEKPKETDLKPEKRPYQPFGACAELFTCREPEVLIGGCAGGGKSLAAMGKIYLCCEKYDGIRALIVRKTRESITQSALVTWEEKVVPEGHSCLSGPNRNERKEYVFPNGSRVIIDGLRQANRDNTQRVMSTEYDMCFIGSTEVYSESEIERGFDRVYSGKIVTITTAAGNKLSGTANHPILTTHGWVGLGFINEGDYVISRRLREPLSSHANPNVTQHPAAIADVVRALAEAGSGNGITQRVKTVPMDFHGDGTDGYVDVITPFSYFESGSFSEEIDPVSKFDGTRAKFEESFLVGVGAGDETAFGSRAATLAFPASSQKPHAFSVGFGTAIGFGGSLSSLGEFSLPFGISEHFCASFCPAFSGSFPLNSSGGHFSLESWDAKINGGGDVHQSRLACEVSPDGVVDLGGANDACSGVLKLDTSGDQFAAESGDADIDGLGYLHHPPFAGDVAADRVVEVSVTDDGLERHVYNLQTKDSWYYAGNIIVHNCYVQEAIELSEEEWEKITTRLRNNKMPYQQLIADTNPAAPTHWLWRRCGAGKGGRCKYLHSVLEDNPRYWDRKLNRWTKEGIDYVSKLDALTGARKDRLRYGRWVQSEGVVYRNWGQHNIIDPFDIPMGARCFRVFDFGFIDPMVCGWFFIQDSRVYLYRELVRTQTLVEDFAREVKRLSMNDPRVEANICDHDRQDRASLEKYLEQNTISAKKDIVTGIQDVEAMLAPAGDGKPGICIFRNALVGRDEHMEAAGAPIGVCEEMDSYVYSDSDKVNKKELPVDKDNHSLDVLRYMVAHIRGGTRWVAPGKLNDRAEPEPAKSEIGWQGNGGIDWRGNGRDNINWQLMRDV